MTRVSGVLLLALTAVTTVLVDAQPVRVGTVAFANSGTSSAQPAFLYAERSPGSLNGNIGTGPAQLTPAVP